MGVLGVGVDVVHLPRIASFVRRRTAERLANRILSPEELNQWRKLAGRDIEQQVRFLGVR